jgi:transcriptional regulator with XRE-family HTH domain
MNILTLGEKLKALRLEKNLSLQEMADLVGVSKGHVYELENDYVNHPSVVTLGQIAKVFGIPFSYFIEDEVEYKVKFKKLEDSYKKLCKLDREFIEQMVQSLLRIRKENNDTSRKE